MESISDTKALVTEGDMNWGRGRQRGLQKRDKSRPRSKSKGRPTCFFYGKLGHFHKNCRHCQKEKGGVDGLEPKKIPDRNHTSVIDTSEEELLLICEQNEVNLVSEELTWVVDSGASFHPSPDRECFSSYRAGEYGYVKMGNDDTCKIF